MTEEQPGKRRYQKTRLYTDANGVCNSLGDWSRISGINLGTLTSRVLRLGWTIDQAISTPAAKIGNRAPRKIRPPSGRGPGPVPRLITHAGLTLSIPAWAARLCIHRNALIYRLKHWPIDQALTTPKGAINPRKKGRPPRFDNKETSL